MFYHISKIDHGEKFKFVPRVPQSAYLSKEGNIPRVCVAEDVYSCLKSISGQKVLYSFDIIIKLERSGRDRLPMAIYATKRTPYLPPDVSDFRSNGERWFLTPVTMRRVGYVDIIALTKGRVRTFKDFKIITGDSLCGPGKDVPVHRPRSLILP